MSDNIDFALDRIRSAYLAHDYEQAERIIKNILKRDPGNPKALFALGTVFVRSGNDEQALQVYEALLKDNPDSFDALNNLGGIYRRLGKYEKSIEVLGHALVLNKNTAAIYYNMGQTYKLMGKFDDATQCFITVIDDNPEDVLAYNHLGCIYAQNNEHQKALQTFWRALQVDPNHPVLHYNSALSLEAVGKYDDALVSYENALRSKPGWTEVMKNYSLLLQKMKRFDEAETVLRNAASIDVDNCDIHARLGNLLERMDNMDQSEVWYRKALQLDQNHIPALVGLESILERKKSFAEAWKLMQHLEQLDPDNSYYALQSVRLMMVLGKYEEAAKKLHGILELEPDNPFALGLQGQYFSYKGDQKSAQQNFEKLVLLDPENITYRLEAAKQLYIEKKYQSAVEHLQYYLNIKSNDVDAWLLLGHVYEDMGNIDKAIDAYRKALEVDASNSVLAASVSNLCKHHPENIDALELLNDIINAQTTDEFSLSDIESLEASLKQYEDSLSYFNKDLVTEKKPEPTQQHIADYSEVEEVLADPQLEEIVLKTVEENPEKEMDDLFLFSTDEVPLEDILRTDSFEPEDLPEDESLDSMVISGNVNTPLDMEPDPFDMDDDEIVDLSPEQHPETPKGEKPKSPPGKTEPTKKDEPKKDEPSKEDEPKKDESPKKDEPQHQVVYVYTMPQPPLPKLPPEPKPEPEPEPEPEENLPAPEPEQPELPKLPEKINIPASKEIAQKRPRKYVKLPREQRHTDIVSLLKFIRDLCDHLPPVKRELFLSGEKRLKLEYLIERLNGNQGLLAEAEAIRDFEILSESNTFVGRFKNKQAGNTSEFPFVAAKKFSNKNGLYSEKISETLLYLRDLSHHLDDSSIAAALDSKITSVLRKYDNALEGINK